MSYNAIVHLLLLGWFQGFSRLFSAFLGFSRLFSAFLELHASAFAGSKSEIDAYIHCSRDLY